MLLDSDSGLNTIEIKGFGDEEGNQRGVKRKRKFGGNKTFDRTKSKKRVSKTQFNTI